MDREPPHDVRGRFRRLVEEHKERIYYLALDLTGDHHDAEDLSQEAFLRAYDHLEDFDGDASLYTWLYRITVNIYLNRQRKTSRTLTRLWEDLQQTVLGESSAPAAERRVIQSVRQKRIEEALEVLSPRERTAFVLRYYHEQSIEQTARAMEVAEGTVKSFLYRATRKLREALSCYRHELGLPDEQREAS